MPAVGKIWAEIFETVIYSRLGRPRPEVIIITSASRSDNSAIRFIPLADPTEPCPSHAPQASDRASRITRRR